MFILLLLFFSGGGETLTVSGSYESSVFATKRKEMLGVQWELLLRCQHPHQEKVKPL